MKKSLLSIFALGIGVFLFPFFAHAYCESGSEAAISQYGITWTFDKTYQCGKFATGDYWVVGPVLIKDITPAYDANFPVTSDTCTYPDTSTCTSYSSADYGIYCPALAGQDYCVYRKAKNGWMVNPSKTDVQGFDASVSFFQESAVPSLPYLANANESIVKSVSRPNGSRPILKSLAVLTVLGSVPPDMGASVFRPPYFGSAKPLYSVNNVDWSQLPSYVPSVAAPPLADFRKINYFMGPQLDYLQSMYIDYLHPLDNMPNDGGALATRNGSIALRLMLNDPLADKKPLAIDYIQHGIDLYYAGMGGMKWSPDGQIYIGRKLPIAFAALLLGDQGMKNFVMNADDFQFQENGVFHRTANSGQVLWSMNKSTYDNEWRYWDELVRTPYSGGKVGPDPYKYIDGSSVPGVTYLMSGNALQSKKFALAVRLMPGLRPIWNDEELLDFADRWTDFGIWAQPDPCAPPTGVCKAGTLRAGTACTMANSYLCNHDSYNESLSLQTVISDCDYLAKESTDRKVKYGEDPANPWHCISDTDPSDGIGRIPFAHSIYKNQGQGSSPWTEAMWNDYMKTNRADVNNSSSITAADALLVLRNSLGLTMAGTGWVAGAATGDANCDGISNSADALLILRYTLGLDMSKTAWCVR